MLKRSATGLMSQRRHSIFANAGNPFARKGTGELLFTWGVFAMCRMDSLLTSVTPTVLSSSKALGMERPVLGIVKHTFFRHFCGGEDASEIIPRMQALDAEGIKCILDLAVESDISLDLGTLTHPQILQAFEHDYANARNLIDQMKESVDIAANVQDNCVAVKFTCLLPTLWLKSFSALLLRTRSYNEAHSTSKGIPWFSVAYKQLIANELKGAQLSDNERFCLENFDFEKHVALLRELMSHAARKNVKIMIDAEQTYFQPAIDFVALQLLLEYNKTRPLLYNTYQMYLKDGLSRLKNDFSVFRAMDTHFAVKMVRGAYMKSERQRASELGQSDPINSSVEETHRSYNSGIDHFAENSKSKFDLLIASHNKESIEHGIEKLGDAKDKVSFGQLLGMSDFLTTTLASNSFRAYKYLPYGPVVEVIPYLQRRAIENSAVLSNSAHDVRFIKDALRGRFYLK